MISNISAITVQCQEARSTDEGAVPKQDAPDRTRRTERRFQEETS